MPSSPPVPVLALQCLFGLTVLIVVANYFFKTQTKRFFMSLFGSTRHIEVSSPELAERIRTRYNAEISQLISLEFNFLFFEGQTSPLLRALLLFPALIMLLMWWKREVITIQAGPEFVSARPIFASADKSSYAHPNGLGIMFHTSFADTSLLVSTNYGESSTLEDATGGRSVRTAHKGASIRDTWAAHQRDIQSLESEGRIVSTRISFANYIEIIG